MSRTCRPILVVEDDASIREAIREALELEGYNVATASDGLDALRVLETIREPCLVLLDIMMPRLDGWGFLRTLRHDRGDVFAALPVIVVTAAPDIRPSSERPLKVLKKPIDLDVLYRTVASLCVETSAKAA